MTYLAEASGFSTLLDYGDDPLTLERLPVGWQGSYYRTFATPGVEPKDQGFLEASAAIVAPRALVFDDPHNAERAMQATMEAILSGTRSHEPLSIEGLGESGWAMSSKYPHNEGLRIDYTWRRGNLVMWILAEGDVRAEDNRRLAETIDSRAYDVCCKSEE
jgi:hypothetical protein